MPINALRFIRKMRGGAQAHLLEADDGHYYVVKFRNNPQHRRILINELIAGAFLDYLQITTPAARVIHVGRQFLDENPDVHISLGQRRVEIEPGPHFGSRYPGDPVQVSVYDFIPDVLLRKVVNWDEFAAVLVFDKWLSNADSRQSIFYRARLRQPGVAERAGRPKAGFVAEMIDHGYILGGPHWEFTDSAVQGLFFRPAVYEGIRSIHDFQPWLERVLNFPESVVDDTLKRIPLQWLDGEGGELERLLELLMRRRRRVPDLISDCRAGRSNPFPNWD